MFGLFDKMFDFNHDGKLDSFEKAARFATFVSFMEEEKRRNSDYDEWDDDFDEDEDDCF